VIKTSEKEFQSQIIDLAHRLGWYIVHFRPAMTKDGWRTPVQGDGAGFFDCIMFKPPRIIFAELKSEKGKLTKGFFTKRRYTMGEEDWLEVLQRCQAVETYVWRPTDFETIVRILQGDQKNA